MKLLLLSVLIFTSISIQAKHHKEKKHKHHDEKKHGHKDHKHSPSCSSDTTSKSNHQIGLTTVLLSLSSSDNSLFLLIESEHFPILIETIVQSYMF